MSPVVRRRWAPSSDGGLSHASRRAPLEYKHEIIPQHVSLPSLFVCSYINTCLYVCQFPVGVLPGRWERRQGGADDILVFQTRDTMWLFWHDKQMGKGPNSHPHLIWKLIWHRRVKTRSANQCSVKSDHIWTALVVCFGVIRDLCVSIRKALPEGHVGRVTVLLILKKNKKQQHVLHYGIILIWITWNLTKNQKLYSACLSYIDLNLTFGMETNLWL